MREIDNRIKDSFDQIHADEALKARTRAVFAEKAQERQRRRTLRAHLRAPALAVCLLLLLSGGGYWVYFLPTAKIDIDINPSVALSINRFNKVLSVEGYNADGQALAASLKLHYLDCSEAVSAILSSDKVASLLAEDALLSIAVIGEDDAQCGEILARISQCTEGQENAYCYRADPEEAEAAREAGLSCGKYRVFLELQALDPSITPEQVQGMSMRALRAWIEALSETEGSDGVSNDAPQAGAEAGHGAGGHGAGQGSGNNHRNGGGNGNAGQR